MKYNLILCYRSHSNLQLWLMFTQFTVKKKNTMLMKNGFFLNDGYSDIIKRLTNYSAHEISMWLHSSFLSLVTWNSWRGAGILSIKSRLVTLSKLAWPASSGAAVFAASCLSESPVPVVVGRSTGMFRETKYVNKSCQQHREKQSNLYKLRLLLTALGYGFL